MRFFNGTDIDTVEGTYITDSAALKFFYERMEEYTEPNIVDVGTGYGTFLLLAALHPGASVIGFEPVPVLWNIAHENVILNNLQVRTHIYKTGLWDRRGVRTVTYPQSLSQMYRATMAKKEDISWKYPSVSCKAAVRSLDEMVYPGDQIDLIKISVGGAEFWVLMGATQTVARHRPDMLIRFSEPNCRQFLYNRGIITAVLDGWGTVCKEVMPGWLWVTWPE